nr:hypothetical protein [Kibdelosporangium sp. MJ126-NF4]
MSGLFALVGQTTHEEARWNPQSSLMLVTMAANEIGTIPRHHRRRPRRPPDTPKWPPP